MKATDTVSNIRFFRRFAVFPDGKAIEVGGRDQCRGVLAGIEADAFGIAIGIDAIAMKGGADGRDIVQQPVIELMDMPVGVGENAAIVIEPCPDVFRHICSGVGQAENDG